MSLVESGVIKMMDFNTKNHWNKTIYKMWAPVYDNFFNSGKFRNARKRVFEDVIFEKNQKILFVGVGTGADLEWFNHIESTVIGIDYSTEMLKQAKNKFQDTPIKFLQMDAQNMQFPNDSFDLVIGSLVLSVVQDANLCLKEMARVLKLEGHIIIFDNFSPKGKNLSPLKRIFRPIIMLLGTDIGVKFESLLEGNNKTLTVQEDEDVMFNGMYRKIVIKKSHH